MGGMSTSIRKVIFLFFTNWIQFAGFYCGVSLSTLLNNFIDHPGKNYGISSPLEIFLSAPLLLTFYLIQYIMLAILAIFVTDMIAMALHWTRITVLVLVQWFVISSVVLYYAAPDMDLVFLTAALVAFLITQIVRARPLKKIMAI
jgi:hypothetical protein